MQLFVCIVPVCPVRAEDSHRGEQTTQMLFGEMATWLDASGDFVRVKLVNDGYEGWCQQSQLTRLAESEASSSRQLLALERENQIYVNGEPMHIPLGSSLGLLNHQVGQWGSYQMDYKGKVFNPTAVDIPKAEIIRNVALQYLNTAYQWGGRSVWGVDCSGLCQVAYSFAAVQLPRDAWQQAGLGEGLGFIQEGRLGDLAFFDNDEGRIVHVGILLSPATIIHASGRVRIDMIDHAGIINSDTKKLSHKLRIVKRYF